MAGCDDRCAGSEFGEIGTQPVELRIVNARFPGAVLGGLDGIQDDEVIALVIEGVVRGPVEFGEEFLAISGAVWGD